MRAASGPIGGDNTHEFLVLAPTGESEVFYDSAITDLKLGDREIDYDDRAECAAIVQGVHHPLRPHRRDPRPGGLRRRSPRRAARSARGIEVGQIFFFGTKYSEPMGAVVVNDERRARAGRRWARTASACQPPSGRDHRGEPRRQGHHLARGRDPVPGRHRQPEAGRQRRRCGLREALQGACTAKGLEPLYDDRDERAGAKFATMDLIGLPWRITVGPRGLATGKVELTSRRTGVSEEMSPEDAVARVAAIYAGL